MSNFNQAENYEKDSSNQRRDGHTIVEMLAPEKGMKILDLGCGTGYFSKFLADLVGPDGQVVGVDPDGERLKVAREKYAASNLKYIEGGAEKILESDYDIVFSNYVLHWIEDKESILKQVSHCLKKGGRFAFLVSRSMQCMDFLLENSLNDKLVQRVGERLFYVSENDFNEMSISNGFTASHWEIIENNWKFDDLDDLFKFFVTHFGEIEKCQFKKKSLDRNNFVGSHLVATLTKT